MLILWSLIFKMKEQKNYMPKEEVYLAKKIAYENRKAEIKNSGVYSKIKEKNKELINAEQTDRKSESF